MEADDSVGEVSVQAHSGRQGNRHVGAETHHDGGEGGDGGGAGDEVALDHSQALVVSRVVVAARHAGGALAGAAAVGQNGGVDLEAVSGCAEDGRAGKKIPR